MDTLVREIVNQVKHSRQTFWAGCMPPHFGMITSTAIYEPAADFREPSDRHQAFDTVFLVERDLGSIKQWPLVLDEALRLLAPGGMMVLRLRQSGLLSIFELACFVERWTGGHIETVRQTLAGPDVTLAFRLTNPDVREVGLDSFAFCLVTDGRKPDAVRAFVQSVLALEDVGTTMREILICGPGSVVLDLGDLGNEIRLVPQPEMFTSQGWITRKKNLIVQQTDAENILLAHDRYTLAPGFLKAMRRYGGDFDVIVPRQETKEGHRIPDWVMLTDWLNWSTPGWMEYGDYHPHLYVNGGVTIAKAALLKRTGWSELLFWGQGEDVELTRRLQTVGVTPRLARDVRLITDAMRPGFIEGFERLPWCEDVYPSTKRPDWLPDANFRIPTYRLRNTVTLKGPAARVDAYRQGIVLPMAWQERDDGMHWEGDRDPELSLQLSDADTDLVLSLDISPRFSRLWVNTVAITVDPACEASGPLEFNVPTSALPGSRILHLRLERDNPASVCLTMLRLESRVSRANVALDHPQLINQANAAEYLRSGWHLAEVWGVWGSATTSIAHIRPPAYDGSTIWLVIRVQAFMPPGVSQRICGVAVGGVPIGSMIFEPGDDVSREVSFLVPQELMRDQMEISFHMSRLYSPSETLGGVDHRKLGIGLISIMLARP